MYLATVIDLASRRVVGWAMADHMRTTLVGDALRMAVASRRPPPGLIFHTDRGSRYTARDFTALLADHAIRQSLSRPRQCWDNAVAESWFATLKNELIYRRSWPTRAEGSLTRFPGQFTCRHHAASAAAAGLLSYSTGLRSPIEV